MELAPTVQVTPVAMFWFCILLAFALGFGAGYLYHRQSKG